MTPFHPKEFLTRRDKLEAIARRGERYEKDQAAAAWFWLMEIMQDMAHPESPRLPKFNDLLLGIIRAGVRSRKGKT